MKPLALLFGLALAGCVQAETADTAQVPEVGKADWSLRTIDGAAAGFAATLNLAEPGRLVGQAPCNRYFASLDGDLPTFRPGPIGATRMACDALAAEGRYFDLLTAIERAEVLAGQLTLTGGGHVLVFAPQPD